MPLARALKVRWSLAAAALAFAALPAASTLASDHPSTPASASAQPKAPPAKSAAPSAKGSASAAPSAVPAAELSGPPAESLPPIDEATKLFDMASAANDEGKYAEAEGMLRKVWEKKKTYDVASALGIAERHLGKNRDAAEHLSFALRNLPPSELGATQKAIEDELALAKKEVGTMRVKVNVPGAEVVLDGRSVGTAPIEALFVNPGKITLLAQKDGYESATKTFDVKKGATVDASIEISPRSKVAGYVLGGVGVAGLAAGGVLVGLSAMNKGEANNTVSQLSDKTSTSVCYKPTATDSANCDKLKKQLGNSDMMGNASYIAFGVGAAGLVAGLAYLFWPTPSSSAKPSAQIIPAVSPNAGGLLISGSF